MQVAVTSSVEEVQKITANWEIMHNVFDEHKQLAASERRERDTLKEEFNTQTRELRNDLAALRERVQAEHAASLEFAASLDDLTKRLQELRTTRNILAALQERLRQTPQ